jgi:hypothetical protein
MYEPAYTITQFFPLKLGLLEQEYIDHLTQVFYLLDCCIDEEGGVSLTDGSGSARPFSVMAYHLLFMLALQYKILRIYKEMPDRYKWAFVIESETRIIGSPRSVFDLGLVAESKIANLFRLIDLPEDVIGLIKQLVKNRNDNLAHAKGGIEADLGVRVTQYLNVLNKVQDCMLGLNDSLAESWKRDLPQAKENRADFVSQQLLDSALCLADFEKGELKKYSKYFKG